MGQMYEQWKADKHCYHVHTSARSENFIIHMAYEYCFQIDVDLRISNKFPETPTGIDRLKFKVN